MLGWCFLLKNGELPFRRGTIATPGVTVDTPSSDLPQAAELGCPVASTDALDALTYAPDPLAFQVSTDSWPLRAWVARVELEGTLLVGDYYVAGTQWTPLWTADATAVLHEFSCHVADHQLANCPSWLTLGRYGDRADCAWVRTVPEIGTVNPNNDFVAPSCTTNKGSGETVTSAGCPHIIGRKNGANQYCGRGCCPALTTSGEHYTCARSCYSCPFRNGLTCHLITGNRCAQELIAAKRAWLANMNQGLNLYLERWLLGTEIFEKFSGGSMWVGEKNWQHTAHAVLRASYANPIEATRYAAFWPSPADRFAYNAQLEAQLNTLAP